MTHAKTKGKPKPLTPAKKTTARTPAIASRRTTPDQRWQRTVRFNWDKGGSRGGRR
jgi:hypothetical protein